MPGFDALGRLAIGQVADGPSSAALIANSGSFALSGVAAAFGPALAVTTASYTASGLAGIFAGKLAGAPASCGLVGNAAAFGAGFAASTASYTISWQPFSDRDTLAANAGALAVTGLTTPLIVRIGAETGRFGANNPAAPDLGAVGQYALGEVGFSGGAGRATFRIDMLGAGASYILASVGAVLSHDFNLGSVGSSITGGQFTRKKWRELQEEERRRDEGIARAREAKERREKECAFAKATTAKAAREAARRAEDDANAQRARQQALIDAMATAAGAQSVTIAANPALVAAYAHHAQQAQDEEEAIIRFLLLA